MCYFVLEVPEMNSMLQSTAMTETPLNTSNKSRLPHFSSHKSLIFLTLIQRIEVSDSGQTSQNIRGGFSRLRSALRSVWSLEVKLWLIKSVVSSATKGALLFQPSEAGDNHTGMTGPPTRPHRSTANPNFILSSSFAFFSFLTRPDRLWAGSFKRIHGENVFLWREARRAS